MTFSPKLKLNEKMFKDHTSYSGSFAGPQVITVHVPKSLNRESGLPV